MLHVANALASMGRNGDSELLHVSKNELAQLDRTAKARGLSGLPRNPKTGLHEASWLDDTAGSIGDAVGIKRGDVNLRNTAELAGAVGGLFAGPVGWANTANYMANQGSRVTGGSGNAMVDAGMNPNDAANVGIGLQVASIYNMGATMAGGPTLGGTGTPWDSNPLAPTGATQATGAGANLDPTLSYNPSAAQPPMSMPEGPTGPLDLGGAGGVTTGPNVQLSPSGQFPPVDWNAAGMTSAPSVDAATTSFGPAPSVDSFGPIGDVNPYAAADAANAAPNSSLTITHAPIEDMSHFADTPSAAYAQRVADAASPASTGWTRGDYMLASSLGLGAIGPITSMTNGAKDEATGPKDHTSQILYSKLHRNAKGDVVGMYGGPSDYGTTSHTLKYATGGGIRSFASGGASAGNPNGVDLNAPVGDRVNLNAAAPTMATTPISATDAARLPGGSDAWSDDYKRQYLRGLDVLQPQTTLLAQNAADAARAAQGEKDANKNYSQDGLLNTWGNAISNSGLGQSWLLSNPMTMGMSNVWSNPGKAVDDAGNSIAKTFGWAKGGPIGNKGIAALPSTYLQGPGDGLSDSIPAYIDGQGKKPHEPIRVADGEYILSGDIVSALGGGSSNAGAKKLDAMMDQIRKKAHGTKKQIKPISLKVGIKSA